MPKPSAALPVWSYRLFERDRAQCECLVSGSQAGLCGAASFMQGGGIVRAPVTQAVHYGPWPASSDAGRQLQYDLSASHFSLMAEYFSTAIGIRGKDGVVFGVEKLVTSKLYEQGANKRIFNIDRHIGVTVAGLLADARQLVERAKEESSNYRFNYGSPIPLQHMTNRLSMYVHAYTLHSAVRPFGVSMIVASYDDKGPEMYLIEPSGCLGIYVVHDEVKDKSFELELSWVGKVTGGKHQMVPKEIHVAAEKYAKEALEESDDSDEEDL
ncbi:hypothetical protein C0Q70_13704 [Pomacea canaliculata]|uniref:Proteasome subunit alpha type-3 n=1 Tax=Pomacea canaliculata TaxID=400727 RepID=A0A2T7NY06_POMCA|nr:hypothetical protein C0Q70_13704 [Pomacea canaliculata]